MNFLNSVVLFVVLIVVITLSGCGQGSGSPAAAPQTSSNASKKEKPNITDAKVNDDFVSRVIFQETQGERPEEIQLSVRAPLDFPFDMPLRNNPAVNYFYGPRIWSSLKISKDLEANRVAMPTILIHSAENPQELLMDPSSKKHWEFHGGVDLQAKEGTPIYAPADGVVFSAGTRACVGETVVLRHQVKEVQNIVYTVYNHLQKGSFNQIKTGDIVKRGIPFARVGHTGSSGKCIEGSHLHFEIRTPIGGELSADSIQDWTVFLRDTAKQNPADYVQAIDQACQIRKKAEVANALAVMRKESGAVAPLSAGRCSLKFESRQSVVPPIYRVYQRDQIRTLGLR